MLASGKLPYADPAKAPGIGPSGSRLKPESEFFLNERKAKQEAVALGYEKHGNQSRAIKDAGISYQVFNEWLHRDAPFQERMLQAHRVWKEHLQDRLYHMVDTQAKEQHPNPVPIIFALKGNWPEKYGDRIKVEDPRLDRLLEVLAYKRNLVQIVEGEVIAPALASGAGTVEEVEKEEP